MKYLQIIFINMMLILSIHLGAQECFSCAGVTAVLDVNGNATLIVDGQVTFTDCTDVVVASYSETDPMMNTINITCNDIDPSNGGSVFLPIYMYVNGMLIEDQVNCLSNGLAFVVFDNYQDICCPNEGDCIVVPVEWISFHGESLDQANKLEWLVNEDTQVDLYNIQRKSDQHSDFHTISVISNTFKTNNASYEFLDETAVEGTRYYYRLQQMDQDGNFSYSNVISLKMSISNNAELEIYPNPASDQLEISLQTPRDTNVELKLYNVAGIEMDTEALNIPTMLENGSRTISANISSLKSGVYTLLLENGGERIVRRFMKI